MLSGSVAAFQVLLQEVHLLLLALASWRPGPSTHLFTSLVLCLKDAILEKRCQAQ